MMGAGEQLADVLSSGSVMALPAAFIAGVVMGVTPCTFALYPVAATYCAGTCSRDAGAKPAVKSAAFFVLGNAVAMTALGIVAATVGRTFGRLGGWSAYVVAFIPVIMGVHLLGLIRLPMPRPRARGKPGLVGAFFGGLLFSLVLGPCGTPALGAILSYAAFKGSATFAALLLLAYGLGNGLPLFVVGTTAGTAAARLESLGWSRHLERGAGVAMIALGYCLIWTAR
ncbi:MAG TPA: cytochrome c biogenesis protein CcdA [Polyangiaceae bacterium]|nr:cytochrome c biogenesis protein CcdA [Polyangiaceae bacterium]